MPIKSLKARYTYLYARYVAPNKHLPHSLSRIVVPSTRQHTSAHVSTREHTSHAERGSGWPREPQRLSRCGSLKVAECVPVPLRAAGCHRSVPAGPFSSYFFSGSAATESRCHSQRLRRLSRCGSLKIAAEIAH